MNEVIDASDAPELAERVEALHREKEDLRLDNEALVRKVQWFAARANHGDCSDAKITRLRAALERIANEGAGAVEAYHDPLHGVPVTGDAMRRVAREALRAHHEDEA